jgi:hypothetical protein
MDLKETGCEEVNWILLPRDQFLTERRSCILIKFVSILPHSAASLQDKKSSYSTSTCSILYNSLFTTLQTIRLYIF